MEIAKLIALCNKYSRVQRRIKRLNGVLEETEKSIQAIVNDGSEHIVINGLKWDTINLSVGGTEINGNHYYTFDEAQKSAKSVGKRCPTSDEFAALVKLGHTWDETRKGMWIAGNHDTDHKGSLFFPASGYRSFSNGGLNNASSNAYYWSTSPNASGSANAGSLSFNSSNGLNPVSNGYRVNGFSVRCVSEL